MMSHEGLAEFLYLLGRDHLPTGVIRGIISSHLQQSPEKARAFSDPELEAWARARAEEILVIERRYDGEWGEVAR
jgi:hypothetical protein